MPKRGLRVVSIHTSPERLVKWSPKSKQKKAFSCFNPYQPRKAGEIKILEDSPVQNVCFNPYQPRKAGEIIDNIRGESPIREFQSIPAPKGWWNHISLPSKSDFAMFQSIPAPKGWWNMMLHYWQLSRISVSIHTSPERLVKLEWFDIPAKLSSFNPYQPRKAGEMAG